MKERIDTAFRSYQSVMVQMPTGTGKTVLLSEVVKSEERRVKNPWVWIVVHRRELVEQIRETLNTMLSIPSSTPESTSSVLSENSRIKVMSIQWLSRHYQEMKEKPSLIVIDEAHHAVAKTYAEVMNAYPVAKKLHDIGVEVHAIVGFRNKDLVILEDEFKAASSKFVLMSDDGSAGEKGLVTDALKKLIESGEKYDRVITIGPLIMMKFVCQLTKQYEIPTVASMNPIMIDGTGMCGGCRLTVGGQTKFACVDGPEFDGHLIDFDEAMARGAMYRPFERKAHEETCNLFKEVK